MLTALATDEPEPTVAFCPACSTFSGVQNHGHGTTVSGHLLAAESVKESESPLLHLQSEPSPSHERAEPHPFALEVTGGGAGESH